MSQQPPPPPADNQPDPGKDSSKKFLNMSGGVLAIVISATVLVCCIAPVGLCLVGGVFGSIQEETQPDPDLAIVSCEVDDRDLAPVAQVQFEITNNTSTSESYWVTITVHDGEGRQVGETSAYVSRAAAGATVTEQTQVYLDAAGGERCDIALD